MGIQDDASAQAVSRYALLMSRYQYEHSVIWQRFGFLLVAQVAAVGFFFNVFVETVKDPKLASSVAVVATLLALCAIGLSVCCFFYLLTSLSYWWLNYWNDLLIREEPYAFGQADVLRNVSAPRKARKLLSFFICSWVVVWIALGVVALARALA